MLPMTMMVCQSYRQCLRCLHSISLQMLGQARLLPRRLHGLRCRHLQLHAVSVWLSSAESTIRIMQALRTRKGAVMVWKFPPVVCTSSGATRRRTSERVKSQPPCLRPHQRHHPHQTSVTVTDNHLMVHCVHWMTNKDFDNKKRICVDIWPTHSTLMLMNTRLR